ncbi:MAG: acireductone synthase [Leptospira sp.]|nr:acireductone synthase [Leptospira sp.]
MIKHNLLDIEGTTAPISFVHQVLFPYAKEKLKSFLANHSIPKSQWLEITQEFALDQKKFPKELPTAIDTTNLHLYLEFLISKDRKFGPLKDIQGKIWKVGYESNELKSTLFPDVKGFLESSTKKGISNHVYSSGSVEAQILIYKYSNEGDLTSFFTSYFDTAVGGKREKESYLNISNQLNSAPDEILFFTDIVEEAEAASGAGMSVQILDRPGNIPQKEHNFPVIQTFKI